MCIIQSMLEFLTDTNFLTQPQSALAVAVTSSLHFQELMLLVRCQLAGTTGWLNILLSIWEDVST